LVRRNILSYHVIPFIFKKQSLLGVILKHLVTSKKLQSHYIRDGEHPFVILASFVYSAKRAKWKKEEIDAVVQQAKANDYEEFIKVLRMYIKSS